MTMSTTQYVPIIMGMRIQIGIFGIMQTNECNTYREYGDFDVRCNSPAHFKILENFCTDI